MRKAIKITLWILCSIIFLVLVAACCLNSQWGQNIVRGKAETFLNEKLKTPVRLGFIGVGFPKFIVLRNILVKDQAHDTLLSLGELKIEISMLKLLNKKVDVQQLVLRDVYTHVYRHQHDTDFNFTYIINAFAGSKKQNTATKNADTTSNPLAINVNKVTLENIHVRFDDQAAGMGLAVDLQQLILKMKKVDIENMRFHVQDLAVKGLKCSYTQDTSWLAETHSNKEKADLQLAANDVGLEHVVFSYKDNPNKLNFNLDLGKLSLQLNRFSLSDNVVDVKKLAMSNTSAALVFGKNSTAPSPVDTIIKIDTTEGWNVTAGNIQLDGVNFKMDNENSVLVSPGIDYAHLYLTDLGLELKDAMYSSDSLSGDLKSLAVKEQGGIEVQRLKTRFTYNQHGAVLNSLYLQTSNTVLQDHLEVHYSSLDSIRQQLGDLQIKANLVESVVSMKDVLIFAPDLIKQKMFAANKKAQVKLEAKVFGTLNDLTIRKLYASGLSNTDILLSGSLAGLPDPEKLSYDLNIAKLQSSAKDVGPFIPDSVLKVVRIPDRFSITGHVAGTIRDYKTNVNLASTDGLAYVKGSFALPYKGRYEKYDLSVNTVSLNIGHIIKQDSLLGPVTANIVAKGAGFDPKLLTASVDGNIISAVVKGYRYHDITLYGKGVSGKWDINMISTDPNARVQLKGDADLSGRYVAARADIKIDSLDLQALKLYPTEFRASGTMHADFPVLDPDYPRGSFTWWDPVVTLNGSRFYMDSLYVISHPSADTGQNITADLGVITARVMGKMPLSKIAPTIQDHITRHYSLSDSAVKHLLGIKQDSAKRLQQPARKDTARVTLIDADTLNITADVVDKPMLHSLLPGLTSFDSIHASAKINARLMKINVTVPNVVYGGTTITNGLVNIRSNDSAFTYNVTADQVILGSASLWYADLHGRIGHQTITTHMSLSDAAKKERFVIAANMRRAGDSQVVNLEPGLKLDYNDWTVAQPNKIVFAGDGFYVTNLEISNNGQFIKINSNEAKINAPMKVEIRDFSLANITRSIADGDTLLANGTLGGVVDVRQFKPHLQATADLSVKSLAILGETLGDLHLLVEDKDESSLGTTVTLKGNGNDISAAGAYYLKPQNGNDFNFKLDVNALSLHSFEGLSLHQVRNSSGYVRGNLVLEGTASAPVITGELHTDNVVTTVSQLNATFKMPAEKMVFTKGNIAFTDFTVADKDGNKAQINGSLNVADISNMQMDMNVRASKWRALQSTQKDNKLYYGDLLITADITAKGAITAPAVDGSLKFLKGTSFTFVNPENNPELESTKGIVRFVNMKDTGRKNILAPQKKKPAKRATAVNSDLNVNITADKDAEFTLVIDQAAGDFLKMKGDANINAAINAGGSITLTGAYALNDGAYQLNYNLVKRKFKIAKGSMITFAGDPIKNTLLDVTAVYQAQVPPYDLVQRQVPDPAQLNYYKQRIPFNVNLYMHGPVLTPRLTFDIAIPEGKPIKLATEQLDLVQSKLSQIRMDTSELNKQVFAILVLNRFVSDEPFNSGAGGGTATFAALQSVSTFLGEQLNRAAGNLVKGVDFSVDLATTEDYTTGDLRQRTDLNLAASKQLLNDRLKLTLGNNFELDGPQTANTTQSSYIPSNLAADYILSPDGKYSLRAYRTAYDVGVLQGFVTETGLNFIVSLDYNNFKNAFRKKSINMESEVKSKKDTVKERTPKK